MGVMMSAGTIITLAAVAAAAGLAVRSMIRDKRNGKSIQCGSDCSRGGGCCHEKHFKE